jgi:hypothetical protein
VYRRRRCFQEVVSNLIMKLCGREASLGEQIHQIWEAENTKGDLGVISKAFKKHFICFKGLE